MLQKCKTAQEASELSKGIFGFFFNMYFDLNNWITTKLLLFLACQDLLMEIEKSPKPYVCAIMGSCLGGGLEVSAMFLIFLY